MDYDIIVIGGGPAGLSAAARAAWLSAPAADYRARILLLESSDTLGGLSRWQPLVVNAPGVFFTKRELKALTRTCEHFGVETRFEQVVALRRCGDDGFDVETPIACYRALAVVLATGCRLGHPGEARLFHRRRVRWFHGKDHLEEIIAQLEADAEVTDLCLCGAGRVAETRRRIGQTRALNIRTFAEPSVHGGSPTDVESGWLRRIGQSRDLRRLRLDFECGNGGEESFETDVLLIDFNAYEAESTTTRFLQLPLRRQDNGFIDPLRDMGTGVDGLFSAGDVNGAPFCVASAISDGTIAGFSAYAHVHRRRHGRDPNLFPYYPYPA